MIRSRPDSAWSRRDLRGIEPVYLWADGIYVKAGLEKEKAALLVIVAGLRDGRKVVLAVESGYRESAEAWAGIYDVETNELLAEGNVLLIDVPTEQFDRSRLNELGWKVYPE